jgi:ankyrin repeat protein
MSINNTHYGTDSLNKNTDKFVSLLLSKEGININCKENIYGRTALHFATERNHIKIMR